tara:strand:+ start:3749 stop:4588 length:840 start_codon:yes stop_codon:yes gene_type:complete
MNKEQFKTSIKTGYANILKQTNQNNITTSLFQCCNPKDITKEVGRKIGYSEEQLSKVPENSNLGVGCGNPIALSSIKKGETILDLGSGAGFDCFLASQETGETGKVIGVDFTPEMIKQSEINAKKGNYNNVEFKIGEIENLPIEDNTIDLIISNCVINLSNQKEKVFTEAFRVAKKGGRLMISDIILLKELPDYILNSVEGHIACLSGTITKSDYINTIEKAGFNNVRIDTEQPFPMELFLSDPLALKIVKDNNLSEKEIKNIINSIASVSISALKNEN